MILHEYIRAKYLTCTLWSGGVDDDDDKRQLKSQLWLQEPLCSVGKS